MTTRWTLVLAAGAQGTGLAEDALQTLCTIYWYPLYAYARRRGYSREDAEDLTQGFLARLTNGKDLGGLDGAKGKFRAFLLASLKHFLANEWDRATRLKRGGGITHLPLDWQDADSRFQIADNDSPGPDEAFDREWALALLERVIGRLQEEFEAAGKARQFAELREFLTCGKGETSYAERAAGLLTNEGTLRVAVHRLRKRYRELLRHEISQTLSDASMVEEELAVLLGAFGP